MHVYMGKNRFPWDFHYRTISRDNAVPSAKNACFCSFAGGCKNVNDQVLTELQYTQCDLNWYWLMIHHSCILQNNSAHQWLKYTVKCRYNAVQFIKILPSTLRWQWQNVNQTSNLQQTPHTSPSRASYGVSIVRIWEKIDRVIVAPHCTFPLSWLTLSLRQQHQVQDAWDHGSHRRATSWGAAPGSHTTRHRHHTSGNPPRDAASSRNCSGYPECNWR